MGGLCMCKFFFPVPGGKYGLGNSYIVTGDNNAARTAPHKAEIQMRTDFELFEHRRL
jgi:hypothetical protein